MKNIALATAALLGLAAFKADQPKGDDRSHAVLWFATAAESQACFLQGYAAAEAQLLARGRAQGKQIVVTDLDETAVNNAGWSANGIIDGTDFPAGWDAWEKKGVAIAVPGAVDFFRLADALGYRICYLSNRENGNLSHTLRNLRTIGFPQADSAHTLLKTEKSSSKEARRMQLRKEGYEIVLLLGDNLSDFVDIPSSAPEKARADSVIAHRRDWGRRFIVFPNPMYGNWLGALSGTGSDKEKKAAIEARLKAMYAQPGK